MSAVEELRLPDLGYSIGEAEVLEWLVAPGDEFAEGQPLLEVDTDKATVVIPAAAAGWLHDVIADAGSRVGVGDVLAVIGAAAPGDGAAPAAESTPPAARPAPSPHRAPAPLSATPFLRHRALALGIDIERVVGTGPGGAITEHDLEVAAGNRSAARPAAHRRGAAVTAHVEAAVAPTVTVIEECDFTRLWHEGSGYMRIAFVVRAVADALAAHPALNAWWEDEELRVQPQLDLGIATETRRGLVVPVVRGCGERSLAELGTGVREVIRAARAMKLSPGMLGGSTFTITYGGQIGGLFATPLLNAPEVAILGVHRVEPRPVVRDGEIVVRNMAFLSCTFDHRATNGAEVGAFLTSVVRTIEGFTPESERSSALEQRA